MNAHVLTDTQAGVQEAVRLLRCGGVVAFPTDTVYGIGAHAFQPAAVARLYTIKQRPWNRAIPLLLARPEDVQLVARDVPPAAQQLMDAFWPGALTIVLPRSDRVPDVVTAGGDTVALRVPDHPLPRLLSTLMGAPLAATSANLSGHAELTTAQEVVQTLGVRVDAILAGPGRCPGSTSSTVVAVYQTGASSGELTILRVGPITRTDLLAVL